MCLYLCICFHSGHLCFEAANALYDVVPFEFLVEVDLLYL
uniref:Uncharacterized protein n=1 Tax=Arundo donax TaxID=35708 RepID=A0A0A9FNS8_ARUDO